MGPHECLNRFLCIHARQMKPDGRALYAYKCSEKSYDSLKEQARACIGAALKGTPLSCFEALFCLYAAETWRRRHAGGVWTWETVFGEIGMATPVNQALIREWVSKGLQWWRRDILKSRQGHSEYLVTIACEGGLPLRLLQQENASLSRYFRELLTDYHRQRQGAGSEITVLAQTAAIHLPKSLRQDIVYHLSGQLIQAIVELQSQVVDADDPLAALERQNEKWRNALPLPVEDDTVKALLGNLVRQAKDLARGTRDLARSEQQRLRWQRRLVQQGHEWMLERHLELPIIVTGRSLIAWTNSHSKLSVRLRLLLQGLAGMEPVALLTRTQGEDETARYRCEVRSKKGICSVGQEAAMASQLWLSDGNTKTELPVAGGETLGDLPWVFVEHDKTLEWLAEGAVQTRTEWAWVLVPDQTTVATTDGDYELKGEIPALNRKLYLIYGTVRFILDESELCEVRCSAESDRVEEFSLKGSCLTGVLNERPVFREMPGLTAVQPDGTEKPVDSALEWRPIHATEGVWRTDTASCAGKVWIRYLDPGTGGLCFRRQVEVLPARARIDVARIGANSESGLIHLSGLAGVAVSIPPQAGFRFRIETHEDTVEIACSADTGLAIMQFPLELRWADGRFLKLILPFPCQGAAFVRGGEVLSHKQPVALGRLGAIQAVAQSPQGGGGYWLEATVRADADTDLHHQLWLRTSLTPTGNGRAIFELHRWQERLDSLLAMSRNLDAQATLEIHDRMGTVLACLKVARFDMVLVPDKPRNRVILKADALERLEEGWESRILVKMIPLWNPAQDPRVLTRDDEESVVAWRVPEGLESGPWWILGCDGDWARFRTLLWVIRNVEATGDLEICPASPLVLAICAPDETRPKRMRELVNALTENPDHPDWPQIFEYFKLARIYPASSMNLLSELARNPEAMALALIRSSEEDFDAVWSLAHQLPFSWHLLPAQSWRSAAERYFEVLRTALGENDAEGSILFDLFDRFRQRVTSHQTFFKSLCDWIQESLFPEHRVDGNELGLARRMPQFLEKNIQEAERELQTRHIDGEEWTRGPRSLEIVNEPGFPNKRGYVNIGRPFRPVRCAPFVAVYLNVHNRICPEDLLFELRQLRDFDQEWFDTVFAIALCLGLAQPDTSSRNPV